MSWSLAALLGTVKANGWHGVLFAYGSSAPAPNIGAAYQAGGAEADICCRWGEPLARTAEQIESVRHAAREAGRTDTPRIPRWSGASLCERCFRRR